ncbi:MAG: PQQ-like beta-propeller repeat protein [Phycisphaerales bacterium]|nr:PQQ-like beta-propeller repeat protein [Phycisphaerales bacterium]
MLMKKLIAILMLLSGATNAQVFTQSVETLHQTAPVQSTRLWTQFGQNASHASISNAPIADLVAAMWVSDGNTQTQIIFLPQSGIVADNHAVYALGFNANGSSGDLLAAFDPQTGDLLWTAPIPIAIFDSWSTPAIDQRQKTIFAASGSAITAINTITGEQRWQTIFDRPIVNASPIITTDLPMMNRLFITDYAFGGAQTGQLYCINIDPFNPTTNPYQPGEIVWKTSLIGPTSGNTPAYSSGIVYTSTAGSSTNAGLVHAFDALSTTAPPPLWTITNPEPSGFFSGVSLADGSLYASSYNFSTGQHNSNTIKVNTATGALIWSTPSNRTDVSPIITNDGRVILSGGTQAGAFTFFGSIPSIQLFDSDGTLLWDSADETLDDANANGTYDPGETYLSLGGWTHQPILVERNGATLLYVGTLADPDQFGFFAPCSDLRLIDLDLLPTDSGFIIDHFPGAGTTPAVANGVLYAVGENGLHAFAQSSAETILNAYKDAGMTQKQVKRRLKLTK